VELRVLFVDDSPDDVELMLRRLRAGGLDVTCERVDSESELEAALAADGGWRVALVDYNLPGFDGITALRVLARLAPDLPAITVSGAITEDTAVATLTAGAVDYVLKDNLARLAPAVTRAVEGAELRRRQRRDAEQARQGQYAIDHASQLTVYVSEDGRILYVNHAAERFGGLPADEVVGSTIWAWSLVASTPEQWGRLWAQAASGPIVDFEAPVVHPDGRETLVQATLQRLDRPQGSFMIIWARDITEQRATEERARETEARYGRLTDALPDVVFRLELLPHPHFSYVNPAAENVMGYSAEEFLADDQLLFRLADPRDRGLLSRLLSSGDAPNGPQAWRATAKDGSCRWMETTLVPLRDDDGVLFAVEGITRDTTEIRHAAEQLAHSRDLMDYVVAHARSAIAIHDRDRRYIYVSERYLQEYGVERQDIIGRHHYEVMPHLPQKWRDVHTRALAGEVSSADRDAWVHEDGRVQWTRWECRPWYEADGGVGGFIIYTEDITTRVVAEEALRQSQAQLRALVDTIPDLVWLKDPEGVYLSCNRRFEQFFGAPEQEIVGKTDYDFMAVELADFFRAHDRAATEAGGPTRNEEEITFAADGHREILETIKTPVRAADGGLLGVLGVGRDITVRKQSEQALRESEERFRRVSQSITDFAYSCAKQGDEPFRFVWLTGAIERITGYTERELREWGCWKRLVLEEDVPLFQDRVTGLAAGETGTCELRIRHRDGDVRWLASYAEMAPGEAGLHHLHGACQDITERKRAEAALRESEQRFKSFAERIPGLITMKDAEHHYVFVHAPEGLGPVDGEHWQGRSPAEVWPPAEAVHSDRVADLVLAGEVVEEVAEWVRGGGPRYFRSLHFPIPTEHGAPLVGGLSLDITDEHEAQAEVLRHAERLRRTVEGAVLAMGHVVETRDPYTAGHERRVAELAVALGAELGLEPERLEGLRLAALIHDIGKIAVPAEILAKPGRLSEVEFNLIRQHARAGYEILAAIEFGAPVAEIVLQHHERLSGSGYPEGLRGESILLEARVLAVADTVEAMSSHRPYRPALGMDAALEEVRRGAGCDYDPEVAAACLRVVEEHGFAFTAAPDD
jgi:PAS domain S-box-containing protein/putative nucleotidyltransferase with HDIG domain